MFKKRSFNASLFLWFLEKIKPRT